MTAPGPRPVDPSDERAHRRRPTVREVVAAIGREVLGVVLAVIGLGGIVTTVYLLGGLPAALLVVSIAMFALGIILLFRPD